MNKRSIVIFPRFDNMPVIDRLRARYDPLADKLRPHVTLVFPFESGIPTRDLDAEVIRHTAGVPPFRMTLAGITGEEGGYLFLNVREGAEQVRSLHDRLYSGALAPFLNTAIPYRPHLTVGRVADPETFASALVETASVHDEFTCTVQSLFLEEILPDETSRVISEVCLARPRPEVLRLVAASAVFPEELREMLTELGGGENGFGGTPFHSGEATLEEYVQSCCDGPDPAKLKPGHVPQTVYWVVNEDGVAVGMVRVRHYLNDWLQQHGGHIGLFIRRAWRGTGCGKIALRAALHELQALGADRALLTVREDNAPSVGMIRACGGQFDSAVDEGAGKPRTLRFWIECGH